MTSYPLFTKSVRYRLISGGICISSDKPFASDPPALNALTDEQPKPLREKYVLECYYPSPKPERNRSLRQLPPRFRPRR